MANIIMIPIMCFLIIIASICFLKTIDVISDKYIEKINKKEENKK